MKIRRKVVGSANEQKSRKQTPWRDLKRTTSPDQEWSRAGKTNPPRDQEGPGNQGKKEVRGGDPRRRPTKHRKREKKTSISRGGTVRLNGKKELSTSGKEARLTPSEKQAASRSSSRWSWCGEEKRKEEDGQSEGIEKTKGHKNCIKIQTTRRTRTDGSLEAMVRKMGGSEGETCPRKGQRYTGTGAKQIRSNLGSVGGGSGEKKGEKKKVVSRS